MTNQFQNLRKRVYDWRQRRPFRRFFAIVLLLVVWPIRFVIQRLKRFLADKHKTRRILVIQFAGLGDALMLTPALAALKDRHPQARIDLFTLHQYVKNAFQNHPLINEIEVLPAYSGQWIISRLANLATARLVFATFRYYPELLLKLVFRRYDVGINFGLSDFDQDLGNALLYSLDIPVRIGLPGPNAALLSDRTDVNYLQTHRAPTYLSFLNPLGISALHNDYEFPVSETDSEAVKLLLRDHRIDSSRPLAVIHPGGKLHINSRRWPAEYFGRVCSFLSQDGFEVLLTGDASDEQTCNEVVRAFGTETKSIAGQLTFSQTAALFSLCQLVITNDTAALHLAEAVRVPRVISIFGPTDPSLLAPQNERHIVFQSKLPCAPCMGGIIDAATQRCWRDIKEECLWQTTPEQVIGVLKTLYRRPAARVARA